jgi:hypothetical protein
MLGQPPDSVRERGDLPTGAASARPPAPQSGMPPPSLDYEALLEALADSGRLADADADQDAVLADELAAAADGRMSWADLAWTAAIAVEHMAPGGAGGVTRGGGRGGGAAG